MTDRRWDAAGPAAARAPDGRAGARRAGVPAAVLRLQRGAGNRAVAQLARRPKPAPPPGPTGLQDGTPTAAYVREALAWWRDPANARKSTAEYGQFLAGRAIAQLGALGVPAPAVVVDTGMAAAGEFDPDKKWRLTMNPLVWTARGTRATTVAGMSLDEAAEAAASVYHEARHAEQHFRMARMQAGKSRATGAALATELERSMRLPANVAGAAAGAPLPDTAANAVLLGEAREWYAMTRGRHKAYKENLHTFAEEVTAAYVRLRSVDPMRMDPLIAALDAQVRAWTKGATRAPFLTAHAATLPAAARRTAADKEVARGLGALHGRWTAVAAAWKAVKAPWDGGRRADALRALYDFKDRLGELMVELDLVYRAEPHEADAYATGGPVAAAFKAAARTP